MNKNEHNSTKELAKLAGIILASASISIVIAYIFQDQLIELVFGRM